MFSNAFGRARFVKPPAATPVQPPPVCPRPCARIAITCTRTSAGAQAGAQITGAGRRDQQTHRFDRIGVGTPGTAPVCVFSCVQRSMTLSACSGAGPVLCKRWLVWPRVWAPRRRQNTLVFERGLSHQLKPRPGAPDARAAPVAAAMTTPSRNSGGGAAVTEARAATTTTPTTMTTTPTTTAPVDVLQRFWGYSSFRSCQHARVLCVCVCLCECATPAVVVLFTTTNDDDDARAHAHANRT